MAVKSILCVIILGMVIAFILGCVEAYIEYKKGNDISEFPAMIGAVSIMNWFYVWYFVKKYIFD